MRVKDHLSQQYATCKNECAITTAADRTFAPFVLNLLGSIKENFPDHPEIQVFDLGMSAFQRKEIENIPGVKLREVPAFVPHWKLCWTWKPYIWCEPTQKYILHLDAGVVVLRSLAPLFLSIRKNDYLAFSQGQKLGDITPDDLLVHLDIRRASIAHETVFAAGVFGFSQNGAGRDAVQKALVLAKEGLGLGWSKKEMVRASSPIDRRERNCPVFRHDQTLINLTLRKCFGPNLNVRTQRKYLGIGGKNDHPRQYLWHARRKRSSMIYFYRRWSRAKLAYWVNRIEFAIREAAGKCRWKIVSRFRS